MNQNEAKNKYQELLFKAKNRTINEEQTITEKHHICPKSLFPKNAKNPKNLIKLTVFEHILAHYYLCFIYPQSNEMIFAFNCMINEKNKYRSLSDLENYDLDSLPELTYLRERFLTYMRSDEMKQIVSKAHKGKTTSDLQKQRVSETWTGKKHSEETKKKMSEARKGYKPSEETCKKLSNSKKGKAPKIPQKSIEKRTAQQREQVKRYYEAKSAGMFSGTWQQFRTFEKKSKEV